MILAYHHTQISVPVGSPAGAPIYGRRAPDAEVESAPRRFRVRAHLFKVGELTLHIGVEDGVNRLATRAHLAYELPISPPVGASSRVWKSSSSSSPKLLVTIAFTFMIPSETAWN